MSLLAWVGGDRKGCISGQSGALTRVLLGKDADTKHVTKLVKEVNMEFRDS